MRSEHTITVIVTDQNDSPSSPRSVHVIVHSFNEQIPLGKIADVHPNDPDVTGSYSCKILQGSNPKILSIPSACDLHTKKITPGLCRKSIYLRKLFESTDEKSRSKYIYDFRVSKQESATL